MTELSKGAIYYTENRLDEKIATACREQLRKAFKGTIVASSLEPIGFGDISLVVPWERSYLTMFKQILLALQESPADIIFMCEHDCLYPPEHFDFIPLDKTKFYYDLNWWKVREDGLAVHWDAVQVSGLVAYRELLIDFYSKRIAGFDPDNFDRKFEPTVNTEYETWRSPVPMIDIRHNSNLTYNKWKLEHFRKKETAVNFEISSIDKIPGWNNLSGILA